MPTNRTRRTRGKSTEVPAWLTHFLATGEEPPEGTPEKDEFKNWYLLAGWYRFEGRNWPPPPWDEYAKRDEAPEGNP